MKLKFILPALTEATSPFWRPIKYSLFPPLGLATLAGYVGDDDECVVIDEHVEPLTFDDEPDVVVVQVYVTNAHRAYAIADRYRSRGTHVCLGGLHVTSLPEEAALHADSIFVGPGEETFPRFLDDLRRRSPRSRYTSTGARTLDGAAPVRRDLIHRERYLVPNSIVVSRGCPHHCSFCYKDGFFAGGTSFYTQRVDDALTEIERLPGRHLYFLDDHLLGNRPFASALFSAMRGMGRIFQCAATVDSILRGDLIKEAAAAGLRSVFVGFESQSNANLLAANKKHNVGRDYLEATKRLEDLGIMINGSFVFGLDHDGPDVFDRTVDWAVSSGITTATFHVLTPYPGTLLFDQMARQRRIVHRDWDLYDTRHVVFRPTMMTAAQIEDGYWRAYRRFYRLKNIVRASLTHTHPLHVAKHLAYAVGWKKLEPMWDLIIRAHRLPAMLPALESVLTTTVANLPGPTPADPGRRQRFGCAPMLTGSTLRSGARQSLAYAQALQAGGWNLWQ